MQFVTLVVFYPPIRYGALPAALLGSHRIPVRRVLRGAGLARLLSGARMRLRMAEL
ncbi:MAG: hypothetical protein KBA97_01955 [Methanothrix sp.]|nr:hypothetical protein [Methanothrix sp.]